MYRYKVQVQKVSGKLNESVLPSKNLVVKSKTKKSKSELLSETSKFFKNKYGLTVESIGVQSDHPKYVAKVVWGATRELTRKAGELQELDFGDWWGLGVYKIYFSTKEELLQQIEKQINQAPPGAAKKMRFTKKLHFDYEYANDGDEYYVSWYTTDSEGEFLMTGSRKHFFEQIVAFNIYDNTTRK